MPAAVEARTEPVAGVQIHPLWAGVDDAGIARQLDQASASGARMVRVDVGWASLEQDAKGEWQDWYLGRLDRVVQGANARGLRLLLTLTSTPCWASTAPETRRRGCSGSWWDRDVQNYAPADPRDYAAALGFLVGRYGDRVAGWEIWNEPNQRTFFKASDPAVAYAALLKAAYAAAKAADPATVVIGGSLAEADFRFTERLYQLGVKGSFDAWSIHPYSGDRSPLDRAADGDGALSLTRGVPLVREVMLAHGDDKPLWLTELGWSTSSRRGGPSWSNGVDPATQAANLSAAFERLRSWPYVAVGVWYNLIDSSADPADRLGHYGLLDMAGRPKPAHAAFRRAAAPPTSRGRPGGIAYARVVCGKLRCVARGVARRRGELRVGGFRFDARAGGFPSRATVIRTVRASAHGRFMAVLGPSTRRWRALVCPSGTPPRAATPCR